MTLRVTDLAVARGGVPVLDGVSFAVEQGAALILRGPNGAGKTTLLRCIAGFEPAGAGTYALHLEHPERPTVPLARERARLLKELIPIAG